MVEQKENKERFFVGEVATKTKKVIVDSKDENPETQVYSVETGIAKILNNQEKLMKLLD